MSMTIARYFSQRDTSVFENSALSKWHETGAQRLPMLHSQNLFALTNEVRICHAGEEYRLRLTRNNRLILTK